MLEIMKAASIARSRESTAHLGVTSPARCRWSALPVRTALRFTCQLGMPEQPCSRDRSRRVPASGTRARERSGTRFATRSRVAIHIIEMLSKYVRKV
jgi:hypothetical protein